MKVLIIEDESVAVRGLKAKLRNSKYPIEIIAVLDSVDESIHWLLQHQHSVDLIFMDIHLKDGSCFQIFEEVEVSSPIVFCTAYEEYAIQAFQVNSINYLLKPFTQEDIDNSISKYKKLSTAEGIQLQDYTKLLQLLDDGLAKTEQRSRFLVKVGNKYHYLNVNDIAYIYIDHKVVYARTFSGKTSPLDYSIEDLENVLPKSRFFRINRQQIISIQSVQSFINDYGRYTIRLEPCPGEDVFVSRYRAEKFKSWLNS